jgi:hypothetical protein
VATPVGAPPVAAGPDDPAVTGPRAPDVALPARATIEASIQRGREFLLERQNPGGSWGSARRTKGLNIYAPVPGAHHAFRATVTSLCISALSRGAMADPRAQAAVAEAEQWLIKHLPRVKRATGNAMYNNWAHAYALTALADLIRLRAGDEERCAKLRELMELQIDRLGRYESVDGGWGYYDFRYQARKPTSSSISFVNATVLVAMKDAERCGVEIPPRLVRRAIDATLRQRKPDFSYLYGEYLWTRPMRGINRPPGSVGRSQACNYALRLWGDETVTDDVIRTWLDRLYARTLWLDIGRKRPIPHEAWFQVAGYFYYYGHYYAGLEIDVLPEADRDRYRAHLAHEMLERQEKDGSWWDYPFYDYHQPYGTAYALMALERCLPPEEDATP